VFYNQRRRHSTLGLISPAAFERQAAMDAAVPVDAQNAATATWKTAQNAVSHSAHSLSSSNKEMRLRNERQLTQPVH